LVVPRLQTARKVIVSKYESIEKRSPIKTEREDKDQKGRLRLAMWCRGNATFQAYIAPSAAKTAWQKKKRVEETRKNRGRRGIKEAGEYAVKSSKSNRQPLPLEKKNSLKRKKGGAKGEP